MFGPLLIKFSNRIQNIAHENFVVASEQLRHWEGSCWIIKNFATLDATRNKGAVMKSWFRVVFLLFLPYSIWCDYEPRLASFVVEGKQVVFTLTNGWVFVAESPLESKHYALDRLIGTRARIDTYPHCPLLELTFENPERKGQERISFPGWMNKEVYDSLLTVTNIEIQKNCFYQEGFVTLSDGSRWYVKTNLDIWFADNYWAKGDKIAVTRRFTSPDDCTLVNQDVSGYAYIDYYKNNREHYYSMRDPRSILVIPAKNKE